MLQQRAGPGGRISVREETAQLLLSAIRELSAALKMAQTARPVETSAVDVMLSIVPLAGIVFGCVLIFFFLLWRYRITQELIRTKMYVSSTRKDLRAFVLLISCLSMAAGVPLTILLYAVEKHLSYSLLGGLIPLSAGIGLLVFFALTRPEE